MAFWVRLVNAVIRSMVLSTTKPVHRGAIIHPGDVSVLVALEALSDLTVSVKGLIVM